MWQVKEIAACMQKETGHVKQDGPVLCCMARRREHVAKGYCRIRRAAGLELLLGIVTRGNILMRWSHVGVKIEK